MRRQIEDFMRDIETSAAIGAEAGDGAESTDNEEEEEE
jgi:hypothetical protein